MAKEQISFEEFLLDVPPHLKDFIVSLDEFLQFNKLKLKIERAANGPVASYLYDKKTVFNFVFRKSGMVLRLYANNVYGYQEDISALPKNLLSLLENANVCKSCNSRCPQGYQFSTDRVYNICRYSFMLPLELDTAPYLENLIKKEVELRINK